jgi:hypothetical protein
VAGPERSDHTEAVEPVRSRDEESIGWGDERNEPSEDADLARLLADRPPHHDRD